MQPLQITTTTHAMTIASYVMCGVLAGLHATGAASHTAVTEAVGPGGVAVWVLLMLVGAVTALGGALAAPHHAVPTAALVVESVGSLLLALTLTTYAVSLTLSFGWSGGPTTQTLAYGLGLGAAARTLQIVLELRRLCAARASATAADPVLGDPTHTND